MYPPSQRIEIIGGIASGKTTLARLLENLGICVVYEHFTANPFYKAFYQDPIGNAFEAESTFLLQHFHQVKMAEKVDDRWLVCDFSFVLDLSYADVTLSGSQLHAFSHIHDEVTTALHSPRTLIELRCSPEEQLRRIRERGRQEESNINLEYLDKLSSSIHRHVAHVAVSAGLTSVLSINSETLNFAYNPTTRQELAAAFLNFLKQR